MIDFDDSGNPFDLKNIPRGKPKSGRSWKAPERRTSSRNVSKGLNTKWEEKMEKRKQEKARKEILDSMKKQQEEDRQKERERIRNRRRQREENTIKSSTYQVIKNTSKLKKMSKKQRRRTIIKLADLPHH